MVKKDAEGVILRCSFCNKHQDDVFKLIAGPAVSICDECVDVCNDIMADDARLAGRSHARNTAPVAPERPVAEHTTMAALMDDVAGLDGYEQWYVVTFLLGRFELDDKARRRGADTRSSSAERLRTRDRIVALRVRVEALSSSDRWFLVMHLLARLRTVD